MTRSKLTIHSDKGPMVIEFFDDDAPNTVKSFISLAQSGFYDGLTFHRCIPNFVAQGGDPTGTGGGGPGYAIACETKGNPHKHQRGSLSMAHAGKDTGGSQFFLVRAPQPHLDGKHTVFGQIIEGVDIVEKLSQGDKMTKLEIHEVSDKIANWELKKLSGRR